MSGITRNSILTLAKDNNLQIEERDIYVTEIIDSIKSGSLTEAFGVGTAATIAHIESIGYKGEQFVLNPLENRKISLFLSKYLNDYKRGRIEDRYNWLVKV